MMKLLSPKELKKKLPVSKAGQLFIENSRSTATKILQRKDPRIAIIVGPCSIHNSQAAIEYGKRLKKLSEEVLTHCFLVMRVYVEKSRTSLGWKGFLYDPHLDGSYDISAGLHASRQLFLTLAELQLPTAMEFVDPLVAPYVDDLITWGFIGARTSASQTHRQLASWLQMPMGFKNTLDGNIDVAIHGALAARSPQTLITIDADGKLCTVESPGNLATHIVLRGSLEEPNYDSFSVQKATQRLSHFQLPTRLLIDCAHGNCQKQYEKQRDTFFCVLEQIEKNREVIFGLMLESNLEAGNQPLLESPASLKASVSITDPCIDWSSTEELISSLNSQLSSSVSCSSSN